jgi:hypothetical protein
MDAARASAVVEELHDWDAATLFLVYAKIKGNTWAERALRAEADLRELVARVSLDEGSDDHADPVLDVDEVLFAAYWALEDCFGEAVADMSASGLTREWLERCVADGWYRAGGLILERLAKLREMEVLSQTTAIGLRSDHTAERRVLRCHLEAMARLPHPVESLPDPPDLGVPGPFVEQQADAEAARLEREQAAVLPLAKRYAEARLATYHAAYTAFVEARLANIVPFCLGRFDRADWNHGTSRRRRPAERQAAIQTAHEIASKYGHTVRTALLAIPLERLHRERAYWAEQSYEKRSDHEQPFADACRPLTLEVTRLLEDFGLENRPLQGYASYSGHPDANLIVHANRWETDPYGRLLPSAPIAELRALKDAASNVRQRDLEEAR